MSSLLSSGDDLGTPEWGIPMTAEEESFVNLPARMQFANDVAAELLPFLQSLPTFGGAYIDQTASGGLVVLLTERDAQVEERIRSLEPDPSRGVDIRPVSQTYVALQNAAAAARDVWSDTLPGEDLLIVAVDTANNRLRLEIDPSGLTRAVDAQSELEGGLGVQLSLEAGTRATDDGCTGREYCTIPMKSGNVIRKGSTSGTVCTMGFHIRVGSDEQFVTAGHCGGYPGTHSWYHKGYGFVGSDVVGQNLLNNGADAKAVQMPDSQASDDIYGSSSNIVGSRNPILGEAVCGSMGVSNAVDCGWVADDWTSWTSSTCGCAVWGGDHDGIVRTTGDSGSPIYVLSESGAATGVGIHNNTNGNFARLGAVLIDLGATIVY